MEPGRGRDISVPIHLTHQVINGAEAATLFKKDCLDLKHKTQQLELLLQQVVAFVRDILYDHPTRRIMEDTLGVIHLALELVTKCRKGGLLQRLLTKVTTAAIHGISSQLENSIRNVSWLLRVGEYSLGTGIPPIAAANPILINIWEVITILHTGSTDDQCNAAASLIPLLSDDLSFRKSFIEEDGVLPLSRILKEGTMEGRENAARALVGLVKDPKSKRDIKNLFCSILGEGPIIVQAAVALGLSEISERGHFDEEATVKAAELFVSLLAFGSVQSSEKELVYTIAAKALSSLIKSGNDTICKKIVNSNALSHLTILLDNEPKESRYIFIMTLLEITELAEKYDLFQSYFQPNLLVRKAIVDLLFKVTHEMEDSKLLVPCIKIIGNLALNFGASRQIRMIISTLVKLLDINNEKNAKVCRETCMTLIKFVKTPGLGYRKEIIIANGAKYLVRLVHLGDEIIQIPALILLCYVAWHVPESKELADAEVFATLEWARQCKHLVEDKDVEKLLPVALSEFDEYYIRFKKATLKREKLHQIAFADCSVFVSSIPPLHITTTGRRGSFISVPTHMTYPVINAIDTATLFKEECLELKLKTKHLRLLLQQAACATDILYDCPTQRIMNDTREVIRQALVLVTECRGGDFKHLFTKISAADFHTISSSLENSICNVTWLICDNKYSGVPPIAVDEPILCNVWELVNIIYTGSDNDLSDAVTLLISWIRDNQSFRKLFIEEDGIFSLSKLLKEGTMEGRENAARALIWFVKDPKCLRDIEEDGILHLSRILKEGTMEGRENAARALIWLVKDPKSIRDIEDLFCSILEQGSTIVQAAVAWGISEITERGHFDEEAIVRTAELLVSHLAFNGVQSNGNDLLHTIVAKAISNLIKLGNYTICRKIVHSRALFDLAILLDSGPKESRYVFIMTFTEIAELAGKYDLFESFFRPNMFVHQVIVDLFLKVTHEMEESKLLVPCIKILGNLARSFAIATDVMMISRSLLKLLENNREQKVEVCVEACITIVKFVRICNSYVIVAITRAKNLVQLVKHSGDEILQIHAMILLCHLTQYVPESKELADAGVQTTLEWARQRKPFVEDKEVEILLKSTLVCARK